MAISPERQQYIADLANDEWVDRLDHNAPDSDKQFEKLSEEMGEELDRFLRTATDPEELHLFAELWNWDGGTGALEELIRNPACDTGTALMIYWRGEPEFFLKYASRNEVPDFAQEGFDLITEIESRLVNGDFATSNIHFDPHTAGLVSDPPAKAKRELPAIVYLPVGSEAKH